MTALAQPAASKSSPALGGVPWAGHAAMFVFAILVGGSFSIGRLAANDITPEALTALRFVLAFGLIGGLAAWQNRRRPGATARAARAPWRYVLLGGSLGFYFVMMFYGLKTAAPVSASAVFTLTPLMAAGFGFLLVGQRMGPAMAGALALGAFGALWVIFRGDLGAALALDIGQGEIYYFIGCVSHALYTPLVARLNRGETAVTFSAGMIGVGAVMLLALAARDLWVLDWSGMPMHVWGALVYLGVFTSAVTFVLLQFSALRLPSAKVMAYTYFIPTSVILWEVMMGNGWPSGAVLPGVLMTIAALIWLLRAR